MKHRLNALAFSNIEVGDAEISWSSILQADLCYRKKLYCMGNSFPTALIVRWERELILDGSSTPDYDLVSTGGLLWIPKGIKFTIPANTCK